MFGWIPIIGPIIDGIVSMFNKVQDKEIVKIQTQGETDKVMAQTSAQTIRDLKDDIGIRLTRDIIMFPVAIWTALVSWDTIMAKEYPNLMFTVEKYPPSLEYLPYAVITFLFGWAAVKVWRR